MQSTTTRIAKQNPAAGRILSNTLALYFRQILFMLVSLYTVRVVLETLGAEDYGIYNVVAGVVLLTHLLSDNMAGTCQRYLSLAIGKKDAVYLQEIFSVNVFIFLALCIASVLLLETVGLWFVRNRLKTSAESYAVEWVYQFSIITVVFTMLAMPFKAIILSYEDMGVFSVISIFESFFKLGAVVLLSQIAVAEKLIVYAFLLAVISLIIFLSFLVTIKLKYRECNFILTKNLNLFKEIVKFNGYNFIYNASYVFKLYLVTILLNQFFNPVVIAARTLAHQVGNASGSFYNNFNIAVNPRLIKTCAAGKIEDSAKLLLYSIKISFLLMFVVFLPLVLEIPYVLNLWLKNPPPFSAVFSRLVLLELLVASFYAPIALFVIALGRIKFEALCGIVSLCNMPLSFILLKLNFPPYSVYVVSVFLAIIILAAHIQILKRYGVINSYGQFFRKTMMPLCAVLAISAAVPCVLLFLMPSSFLRLCIITLSGVCMCALGLYLFCLNAKERVFILQFILNRKRKYV